MKNRYNMWQWIWVLLVMFGLMPNMPGCTDPRREGSGYNDNIVVSSDTADSGDTRHAGKDTDASVFSIGENGCAMTEEDYKAFDAVPYEDLNVDPDMPEFMMMLQINSTYHLPYFSGESFPATTYQGHGDAWDFNRSGTADCGEIAVAIGPGMVEKVVVGCPSIPLGTKGSNGSCGSGFGNHVRVDLDGDPNDFIGAHFSQVFVRQGQWVEGGQALGIIGTSGNSSGCHLHFEVRNSNNTMAYPKYLWDSGVGYLSAGASYRSRQQSKIDKMREQLGFIDVGLQLSSNATRIGTKGYKLEYRGNWGDNTMYYEAWGCEGGNYCPTYNNTNSAWNVRGAMRATYNAMGATNSWLGFPTGNEVPYLRGQKQTFHYGYLYWDSWTGVTLAYHY